MNEFIDILQEEIALKRNRKRNRKDSLSFDEKLKILPSQLHSIAKNLQMLVDAKATLDDGSLFQYFVTTNSKGTSYIHLNLVSSIANIHFYNSSEVAPLASFLKGTSQRQTDEPGYFLIESHRNLAMKAVTKTDDENFFLNVLGYYLSEKINTLGFLDNNFYAPKTQDHLGI
jgi:hypothetical protein